VIKIEESKELKGLEAILWIDNLIQSCIERNNNQTISFLENRKKILLNNKELESEYIMYKLTESSE
jgi:hypothetical protein